METGRVLCEEGTC